MWGIIFVFPLLYFCYHHSFLCHHLYLYLEYLARVQSFIPSMTSSQPEHRRSHSLSGWFLHPVWRNTSKKGRGVLYSSVLSIYVPVCICFAFERGLWYAFNNFLLIIFHLFFLPVNHNTVFSLIKFAELREPNHWFFSAYIRTIDSCLFSVAFFLPQG